MMARIRWEAASVAFLRAAVVLIGAVVLGAMLWEPHLEGRNARAELFDIYFKDPFLAYVYAGSVPFFIALRQAFKALGYVARNETFSPETVKSVRTIKRCGVALIGLVAGAAIIILIFGDERPPGIFMCLLAAFASGVIASAGAMFEWILQSRAEPSKAKF